jgi:hypothetical protein
MGSEGIVPRIDTGLPEQTCQVFTEGSKIRMVSAFGLGDEIGNRQRLLRLRGSLALRGGTAVEKSVHCCPHLAQTSHFKVFAPAPKEPRGIEAGGGECTTLGLVGEIGECIIEAREHFLEQDR